MKHDFPALLLLTTATLALIFFSQSAQCGIVISRFEISSNSLSFDISGTFPSVSPDGEANGIFFVNSNVASNPGFALGNGIFASNSSSTGTHALMFPADPVATGNELLGDYLYVAFDRDLTTNESITCSIEAVWSGAAFDVAEISTLNLYWGTNFAFPINPSTQPSAITGGILLANVSVPEPTSMYLCGVSTLAIVMRRRLRNTYSNN